LCSTDASSGTRPCTQASSPEAHIRPWSSWICPFLRSWFHPLVLHCAKPPPCRSHWWRYRLTVIFCFFDPAVMWGKPSICWFIGKIAVSCMNYAGDPLGRCPVDTSKHPKCPTSTFDLRNVQLPPLTYRPGKLSVTFFQGENLGNSFAMANIPASTPQAESAAAMQLIRS